MGRWIGMRFLGFVCFHLFLLDFTVVSSPDDALSKTEPGMWTFYCCYLELVQEQTLAVEASHCDKVLKHAKLHYSLSLSRAVHIGRKELEILRESIPW